MKRLRYYYEWYWRMWLAPIIFTNLFFYTLAYPFMLLTWLFSAGHIKLIFEERRVHSKSGGIVPMYMNRWLGKMPVSYPKSPWYADKVRERQKLMKEETASIDAPGLEQRDQHLRQKERYVAEMDAATDHSLTWRQQSKRFIDISNKWGGTYAYEFPEAYIHEILVTVRLCKNSYRPWYRRRTK